LTGQSTSASADGTTDGSTFQRMPEHEATNSANAGADARTAKGPISGGMTASPQGQGRYG
jgi:hypothetical protein